MGFASRVSISLASCVWLLAIASPLAAQSGDTPPEAITLYAEAREHYGAGRYQDAAVALESALVLDPDSPTLVYNLARVYELLGQLDRALEHYERYQRLLPQQQAEEQNRADATIRRLQGAASSAEASVEAPVEVEPLRQLPGLVLVRENGVADDTFWVVLTAGAVFLAGGAAFGSLALLTRADADSYVLGRDGRSQGRNDLYSNATVFGGVADATLGLGGAAVVVAGLLYFAREHTVLRAPLRAAEGDEADQGSDGVVVEPDAGATLDGAYLGLRGAF